MTVVISPTNTGTTYGGPTLSIPDSALDGTALAQKSDLSMNALPIAQVASGSADAVLFNSWINVCIFTSTGPDAATLATPGAADVGKILILVNTNTTQNVVTTAANKITSGAASAGDTLTAPAHAGATAVLVAYDGFWSMVVGGTGSWVLSEV